MPACPSAAAADPGAVRCRPSPRRAGECSWCFLLGSSRSPAGPWCFLGALALTKTARLVAGLRAGRERRGDLRRDQCRRRRRGGVVAVRAVPVGPLAGEKRALLPPPLFPFLPSWFSFLDRSPCKNPRCFLSFCVSFFRLRNQRFRPPRPPLLLFRVVCNRQLGVTISGNKAKPVFPLESNDPCYWLIMN